MSDDDLKQLTQAAADHLAAQGLTCIIMVGSPDPTAPGHARFFTSVRGNCLETLGLLAAGTDKVKELARFPRSL